MITKEKKTEKICSFYASDYHLEMIMLPYINRKKEEQSHIVIMTQKNLKETVAEVVSKINLPQDKKREILNLDWNNNKLEKIKSKTEAQELVVFIIGDEKYIKQTNTYIDENVVNTDVKIIDCYSLEEAQNNMAEIMLGHTKLLNTMEEKEIEQNY